MARYACVVAAVVFVAVLAGSAAAQTVILRQGLGDYTGVEDTMLESHTNFSYWWAPYANLGEASQGLRLYRTTRTGLLKFGGLNAAIPVASSADIVSATLSLRDAIGFRLPPVLPDDPPVNPNVPVTFYKALHGWVEGTGQGAAGPGWWDDPDVEAPVDGASHKFWNAPVVPDASVWTDEGWTIDYWNKIYSMDVTGKTIGHVMYDKLEHAANVFGYPSGYGWVQSAATTLDEMKNNYVDLEWMQIGDILYVDHDMAAFDNPSETEEGICYYEASDAWGADGANGDADIDKTDPKTLGAVATDGLRSIDVTDWVKAWFDDPESNYGLAMQSSNDTGFYSSEGNNPNTGTGIGDIDVLLGPTLTIAYVPEPATMGLLGLGLAGLAALRRRKK